MSGLYEPADEGAPSADVGVRHRPGALEDEAADERGVTQGELLGDDAAAREARDVGGGNLERPQDRGGVVGHRRHGGRPLGHRRPARPAIVEGGHAVAVREPVELELPRLDRVAEPADQEDIRSLADLLDVDVELPRPYVLSHCSVLPGSIVPALHVLGVRAQVGAGLKEAVVEVEV